jgi:protein tyrosine phosphatase (PTP) superfamily phosphohydrolase (DUF442 family)
LAGVRGLPESETLGIRNVFRVSERLYSGSVPSGEAGFATLKKLGIRTIISVDGEKPDLEAARRHGLRYLHLPIGYDGVPDERVAQLRRVATESEGPWFLHCHRGRHRGPACAAILARTLDREFSLATAERYLKSAGTDPKYAGLYRDVRRFDPAPPTKADPKPPRPLPEVADVEPLAERMIAIERHVERIKAGLASKVRPGEPKRPAPDRPAAAVESNRNVPASRPLDEEATLLAEAYRESARFAGATRGLDQDGRPAGGDVSRATSPPKDDPEAKRAELVRWLTESAEAAERLAETLPTDHAAALKRLSELEGRCLRCHERHRDNVER